MPYTIKEKENFLKVLEKEKGLVSYACRRANIARNTHYRWIKEDEEYAKRVEQINEVSLDFAEFYLFKNIADGKEASLLFYLKCQGKSRGYADRKEIEIAAKDTSATDKKLTDLLSNLKASEPQRNDA